MSIDQRHLPAQIESIIPLSPAQKWWNWARQPILNVEVHGVLHFPVSKELFGRTWEILLERHPLLRAVFPQREQSEHMQILKLPGPLPFIMEDRTEESEEAFWDSLKDRTAALHRKVDLTRWPLIQVAMYTRGSESHLLLALPTLIGDILMVKALSREFTVIYRALQLGMNPPAAGAPDDYGDYIRFLDNFPREKLNTYVNKWTDERSPVRLELPYDHRQGGNTLETERMQLLAWPLPAAIVQQEGRTGAAIAIYSYIWLALVRVLGEWTGREDITVCERTIGRNLPLDRNLFKSAGFYAVDYPVRLSFEPDMSIRDQLETVSRHLEDGSLQGALYNYAYGLGLNLPLPHEQTSVRIDFFGRADSFRATGVELIDGRARFGFNGSEPTLNYGFENVGPYYTKFSRKGDRLYELDLSGLIANGELLLGIYYSDSLFRLRTIQKFADSLGAELTRIAEDAARAGIRCVY
ncbi:hypothetical protein F4V43_13875 [Paenibacillus spiritus]|uniref:Condensation domain-containing protein n=1 Tax=Paenibacillus spiritus TaxID=2496557 RepID=A0A5J5G439_9BACL|nr:condensation domain-containing protein [Paenibacillus spiritus]KAA9001605.1 hypothetical protein F4V43_13875 [Paenibacillus spiritus]